MRGLLTGIGRIRRRTRVVVAAGLAGGLAGPAAGQTAAGAMVSLSASRLQETVGA